MLLRESGQNVPTKKARWKSINSFEAGWKNIFSGTAKHHENFSDVSTAHIGTLIVLLIEIEWYIQWIKKLIYC